MRSARCFGLAKELARTRAGAVAALGSWSRDVLVKPLDNSARVTGRVWLFCIRSGPRPQITRACQRVRVLLF